MNARGLLLLLVVGLLLPACGVRSDDVASRIGDDAVPYGLLDPEAIAVVPQITGRDVSLCLLLDDRLVVVTRRVDATATLGDVARALAEVTEDEAGAGLRTSVGSSDEIASVRQAAGVATVDLTAEASQRLTADPLATVAQVVCSLTLQPGIGLVRFTVADVPVPVPLADGTLTDGRVSADDYRSLLADG